MSKIEVDAIEPQSGTTLTIGASGDTIIVPAGTVSLPAITTTGDTNTGIFFPAADTIAFTEGGTEAMRIDSSGNVGVGTTAGFSGGSGVEIQRAGVATLRCDNNTASSAGEFRADATGTAIDCRGLEVFRVLTGGGERMRIDSSGNVLVGTTNSYGKIYSASDLASLPAVRAHSTSASFADNVLLAEADRNTTNNTFFFFSCYNNGATAFKLRIADSGNVTNTNNSYGAISDIKLKENIVDATLKLEKLNQVRIVNFNFINDNQKQIGVIAQELENIFPSMVEESPDKDLEGNDLGTTTKQVKYSVFVPILIKAIQELSAKVDIQQTKIDALEARITALENK